MRRVLVIVIGSLLLCSVAVAQQSQTGSISGTITLDDGSPMPGVMIVAIADVMPKPRSTVSGADGDYRLPALPPGDYEVTYTMQGFATEKRSFPVRLQHNAIVNVTLKDATFEDEIMVTAETPTIDTTSAELKSAISDEVIEGLPVGQQYRDLIKLVPGVQYTEDDVRGPSAGGSGQDNSYQFDGVSVTLPQYGTLSAEPSTHDVEEVAVVKGGANAVGFNRSGGMLVNTLSRSGTNQFRGQLSYQFQTDSMTGARDVESEEVYDPSYDWLVANLGGPILKELLHFYVSYYGPTTTRQNRANAYGEVEDYKSNRDEFFGKLTFTPTNSLMFHASYRDSETDDSGAGVSQYEAASVSYGSDSTLKVGVFEGSWVIGDSGLLSFKYGTFENKTNKRPDTEFDFPIAGDGSVMLDVNNLDQMGYFGVPTPIDGEDDYNELIASIIESYGYIDDDGNRVGGGGVGGEDYYNLQDFYNTSFQLAYDHYLGNHELHIGYKWELGEEDLVRYSNGWGYIDMPLGKTTDDGTPIAYEANIFQASLNGLGEDAIDPHHSEMKSQSIELNDVWRMKDWTFNLGLVLSNDKLYGSGLRPNSSNPSGFELAPGNQYMMKEIGWDEMISPRLGATWSPNGRDALYASWARYYPSVSSLPRAASWDRNLALRQIDVQFDAEGNLIGQDPLRASSGKLFQEGIDPRSMDEYVIGYDKQMSSAWTGRVHLRHRQARDFWEDTQNNARSRFEAPEGYPQEDYIPDLGTYEEIGVSQGSYVIAQLDHAFTRYYEVSTEAEWRGRNAFFRGSYVWSHYYGTFDQDNTTESSAGDTNTFYGSSYIADGGGRQLWQNRYGDLKGDRRHMLKLYGYYNFGWNGTFGAYGVYQSGHPWEVWGATEYYSGSFFRSRYAEPAGSRRTSSHYQLDLSYTQNFPFGNRFNILLRGEIFNVTDNQTGYGIQPRENVAGFGEPQRYMQPRRFQVTAAFQF